MKSDLDAFDKKLEDAAAAGQFEDSDNEETQWDDAAPEEQHNATEATGPSEDHASSLLGRQSSASHMFDALEPARDQLALEEKSSFSLSQMPADGGFAGLSSLRLEVEDEWFYLDPQGLQQGPFKTAEMREWFEAGYFKPHLPIPRRNAVRGAPGAYERAWRDAHGSSSERAAALTGAAARAAASAATADDASAAATAAAHAAGREDSDGDAAP